MHLLNLHDNGEQVEPTADLQQRRSDVVLLCEVLQTNFEDSGNSTYVFDAYNTSMAVGLFPPAWALEHLNNAFKQKFETGRSFDQVLGFSKKGLGSGRALSPIQERDLATRNKSLTQTVLLLEQLGTKRRTACRAVAAHEVQRTGGRVDIGDRRLVEIVKQVEGTLQSYCAQIAKTVEAWSQSEKDKLLREYKISVAAGPRNRKAILTST